MGHSRLRTDPIRGLRQDVRTCRTPHLRTHPPLRHSREAAFPTQDRRVERIPLRDCRRNHLRRAVARFRRKRRRYLLLQKSLYGIKQAPRLWQQYLHTVLIELGFQELPHDQGMYRLESRDSFILLVAYVDDLLYIRDNAELLDRFEHDIKEKLEMTIDHDVTQFLGLNATQTADTIHLSSAKYAETLAKKFGIVPVSITTPFRIPPPNHEPDTTRLSPADHRLYQQQLGCLLIAAITCRPDLSVKKLTLSYAASQLAQYMR
ncbi:unnamed protein product [Closterium sp. NIES-53]